MNDCIEISFDFNTHAYLDAVHVGYRKRWMILSVDESRTFSIKNESSVVWTRNALVNDVIWAGRCGFFSQSETEKLNIHIFLEYMFKRTLLLLHKRFFFWFVDRVVLWDCVNGFLYHVTWIIQSERRKHERYYYSFVI